MVCYRIAGQEYSFSCPVPDLQLFEVPVTGIVETFLPVPAAQSLICQAVGWIGEAQREAECWNAPPGMLLRVAGGRDFYLAPDGRAIIPVVETNTMTAQDQQASLSFLTWLDKQILLGPALVLALALRGTWSLHASAAMYDDCLIVFLGESGQGKSTLAAHLASSDQFSWRLVADDILPITLSREGLIAWPHFPQLKLPAEAQPGANLPEQLRVQKVSVLMGGAENSQPELQALPISQSVQALLGHIAGTRLFGPQLLSAHLVFCTQAAGLLPFYRLSYPRQMDALPEVRRLLENLP